MDDVSSIAFLIYKMFTINDFQFNDRKKIRSGQQFLMKIGSDETNKT